MTPSRRDRQVARAWRKALLAALLIAGLCGVASLVAARLNSDLDRGFAAGLLSSLPLGLLVLYSAVYRQLDEYGRRLHERAAAAAFVALLTLVALGFAVQIVVPFQVPLWALYALSVATWGGCLAILVWRGRGQP